jgi:hypothetical protein
MEMAGVVTRTGAEIIKVWGLAVAGRGGPAYTLQTCPHAQAPH